MPNYFQTELAVFDKDIFLIFGYKGKVTILACDTFQNDI